MGYLVLGLLLAILVAVFAIQNAAPVEVHFLFWTLPKLGLAVVILAATLVGAALGSLLGIFRVIRERRRIHPLETAHDQAAAHASKEKAPPAPVEEAPSPEPTQNEAGEDA